MLVNEASTPPDPATMGEMKPCEASVAAAATALALDIRPPMTLTTNPCRSTRSR
jgi:hypothetical protein